MQCRQCQGIEAYFGGKLAAKELKRYRKKGPGRATRMLIEALKAEGVEGVTLLDIGGGVGAIQHELLKAGVASATNVDGASAYIGAAREEAQGLGHGDRVSYHFGNFVDLAPQIEPADIVTLDRVICCYHDMEALVGLSSERARRLYGLVYPKDMWVARVVVALGNLYYWAKRCPFRAFIHRSRAVEAVLRRNGFQRRFYGTTPLWQVVVYGR